jgi:hypothetical protein
MKKKVNQTDRGYLERIIFGILLFLGTILFFSLILGIYRKDPYGYFMSGFLPAAILINLSICLSYFSKGNVLRMAMWAWVGLSVVILIFVIALLYVRHGVTLQGADAAVGYPMLILSFPSGLIFSFCFAGFSYLMGPMPTQIDLIFFWFGFFVVGYFQWFKLIPFLILKIRKIRI